MAVWVVGLLVIRFTSNESVSYVNWLKIWALTAAIQAVVFSLILGALFPSQAMKSVEDSIDGAITNSGTSQLSPELQKEIEEATGGN